MTLSVCFFRAEDGDIAVFTASLLKGGKTDGAHIKEPPHNTVVP